MRSTYLTSNWRGAEIGSPAFPGWKLQPEQSDRICSALHCSRQAVCFSISTSTTHHILPHATDIVSHILIQLPIPSDLVLYLQCDEAHPTCNNCKKSKRECLGYDPIFKPQPTPQSHPPPVRIQPAPSPTTNNHTPSVTSAHASPSTAQPSSPLPLPYQAPPIPSSYAPPVEAPPPSTAPKTEAGYGYSTTAIDPALRGFDQAPRSFEPSPRAYDPVPRQTNPATRTSEPGNRSVETQVARGTDAVLRSTEPPLPQASVAYAPLKPELEGATTTGEQHYSVSRPRGGWNTPFP